MNRVKAGIAIGVAAGLLAVAQPAVASPGSPATAIVSLGDSFISGEGGRWMGNGSDPFGTRSGTDRAAFDCGGWGCEYDPSRVYGASEDDDCHRSDVAPIRSAPIAVDERVNLACSGAKTENIWRVSSAGRPHFGEAPQADQLAAVARRDDVRLVVLTVGANDVGFGGLVVDCALDWARSSEDDPAFCRGSAQAEIEATLPAAASGLRKALREIRAAMAGAGYSRAEYRLMVMGYASPFPAGELIRYPEEGWSRLTEGGCPLWNVDADWAVREATPAIAAAMRAAAEREGAEFLDLQHALDGHQLCDRRSSRVGPTGPSPLSAEWFRRLSFSQGSTRESLHPNAYGQRAIGACIALAYAAAPGNHACHDTPGRSYVDGMRLEPLL
jgi:lysophospholipase L1-like esterase